MKRPATPQSTFDKVAPYYDFMNSFLSFGIDRRWRRKVAHLLSDISQGYILDIATGTGAVAISIAKHLPQVKIIGCDINQAMLEVAEKRIHKNKLQNRIQLEKVNGEKLPYEDNYFEAVTIAFAIDDMDDRDRCAQEMFRVLKPGGKLVLLELSMPEKGFAKSAYQKYLKVFPLIRKLVKKANYNHVQKEILKYQGQKNIEELLEKTAFIEYSFQRLTAGIATLHTAQKPKTCANA